MNELAALDYEQIKTAFTEELHKASLSQASSISYLEHPLPDQPIVQLGLVQGIVIGGTNYIISTEEIKKDGTRNILERYTGILPIFKENKTLQLFLEEHLNPQAIAIGVNFGFPLQPTRGSYKELDGILLAGTKEHAFTGMIGKAIGGEIKRLVKEQIRREIPVSVANDTVCLSLAGDGTENGSMIAGTGFNIGIKPIDGIVVNLEAGNFDRFEKSEALQIIDECSDNPGKQLFEKIISGKYLAEVFNIKAERMGIEIPKLKTSQELSALSAASNAVGGLVKELATSDVANSNIDIEAQGLARALLKRSAFLVAAALAGLYEFQKTYTGVVPRDVPLGSAPLFTIIGEGSLLWKGWKYTENIEKKLEDLGVPQNGIRIKHVKDSSINGAIGLITS